MYSVKFITKNIIKEPITVEIGKRYPVSIEVPHMYCPHEISIFFQGFKGVEVYLSYTNDMGKDIDHELINICSRVLSHSTPVKSIDLALRIPINSPKNVQVNNWGISFIYMGAYPVRLSQNVLVKYPIADKTFGFNFDAFLIRAACWEAVKSKVVQIRQQDNHVTTITGSSENFKWKSNTLCCRLPVGKYSVRIKYRTKNKKLPWSKWFTFRHTRKGYRANDLPSKPEQQDTKFFSKRKEIQKAKKKIMSFNRPTRN